MMSVFRGIFVIYKKEMKVAFSSLIAYVILACLTASFNYFFLQSTLMSGYLGTKEAFDGILFLVLLFSPIISMRLIAEERRNKTLELLLSSPVSSLEILLGKYFFALSFFLIAIFISFGIVFVLSFNSVVSYGLLFSQYLGLILFCAALLSIGLMFSAMSENQVTAVILSSCFSLFLFVAGGFENGIKNEVLHAFFSEITLVNHYVSFQDGQIELKDIVYYFLIIIFFLILSKKLIDFKR